MIVVKVRTKDGEVSIDVAEDGDGLFDIVRDSLGIEEGRTFELLRGFPPKAIEVKSGETARQLGIRNNERLILRLGEEQTGAQQYVRRRRGPNKKKKSAGETKRDISESLIKAFQGGPRDNVSVFLRGASRQAVKTQYEKRAGNDRFKAAREGKFRIVGESCTDDEHGARNVEIEYATGSRGAKSRDEVKLLPEEILKATITYLMTASNESELCQVRENLRPHVMAEISPSTFWSLVHVCGGGMDLETKLCSLLPELDWTFLKSRKRTISEKAAQALENERLVKEEKRRLEEDKSRKRAKRVRGSTSHEGGECDAPAGIKKMPEDQQVSDLLGETKRSTRKFFALVGIDPPNVFSVASLDADVFIKALCELKGGQLTEAQAEEKLEAIRKHSASALFEQIVGRGEDELEILKNTCGVSTPFDLFRLKVPGRDMMVSKDLSVDLSIVRSWQKQAQEAVGKYEWLKQIRTLG
uniref:Ubiquitin-like domain-containing protein n=1 Tax=Mucochytrium quahogii TaxID=96639 RepID=A0A7S2W9T9_9STRA|mmetsp:Transcript_15384/g.25102  ORF Transcript_15384/g.25102 Transcript_15384/m.25102 type:complete len:470 (-) Transcript_15384:1942-3351(-)|eukprot:CAMPEP_0203746250 /NCGR_PEP_ID=MMETSP0098-20131031/1744_1 /ASSEMBLY_ACC=CAM_ASM_000208 /TAXON_ID=96639 /ORGANISM=" , Strain NY0313808BC1" /LENGTH=469 /DNA_ID=CAMNT_0050634269 /DNA_START=218 /DNA_END=1627 /DNA_ORIENTATION=+